LLLCFLRPLRARWREPVLRQPVLVLESDDWGAGPLSQAEVLDSIAKTLCLHRDSHGAPAVMTLGLVLAVPRAGAAAGAALETLLAPPQAGNLAAIRAGITQGVFSPQLHGLCHFEPTVLARTALAWPEAGQDIWTESLPDALQSALIDGSILPSRPLAAGVVEDSIRQQADVWKQIFDAPPQVAVPTTFIWTDAAERAWQAIGVRWLVTPGNRATLRDGRGRPSGIDRQYLSGQRTETGLTCLVRDIYFEPARGHHPGAALAAAKHRFARGRPALIEIHRGNFVGPDAAPDSLIKLGRFLEELRHSCSDIRFTSTVQLGAALAERDPAWVAQALRARIPVFLQRIREIRRFARFARYSGLLGALDLMGRAVR
jgi:hypothetical protein